MKVILQEDLRYVLRFDKGEDVMAELKKFCKEQGIKAGFFMGIGSISEIVVSWFNPDAKKYQDHLLTKKLEVVNLMGNVSLADGEPILHAHGSFSDVELHSRSGHVKKIIVAATCEIFLQVLAGEINRQFSSDIGLSLME
jgi:predicted DNA-binding protein with PD1-like motif